VAPQAFLAFMHLNEPSISAVAIAEFSEIFDFSDGMKSEVSLWWAAL